MQQEYVTLVRSIIPWNKLMDFPEVKKRLQVAPIGNHMNGPTTFVWSFNCWEKAVIYGLSLHTSCIAQGNVRVLLSEV